MLIIEAKGNEIWIIENKISNKLTFVSLSKAAFAELIPPPYL